MDNHDQDSVPADILRVYRDMGIWTDQERRVFGAPEESEVCFKWQHEPTGPITTTDGTTPYEENHVA